MHRIGGPGISDDLILEHRPIVGERAAGHRVPRIAVTSIRGNLGQSMPMDPVWWPSHAAVKVQPVFLLFFVVSHCPRVERRG
jgi:hypothetical protein